jgi:hypothetical protein
MGSASLQTIFSRTHPVTLTPSHFVEQQRGESLMGKKVLSYSVFNHTRRKIILCSHKNVEA